VNWFAISEWPIAKGTLGLCPIPGRYRTYENDLAKIALWQPTIVISLTETHEFAKTGAKKFSNWLKDHEIIWLHIPIQDFNIPSATQTIAWQETRTDLANALQNGARILIHCYGGCGRSGAIATNLLLHMGHENALETLRKKRPCVIETDAQLDWAKST
jgi:protein-tyrosine phosphatase